MIGIIGEDEIHGKVKIDFETQPPPAYSQATDGVSL